MGNNVFARKLSEKEIENIVGRKLGECLLTEDVLDSIYSTLTNEQKHHAEECMDSGNSRYEAIVSAAGFVWRRR